MAQVFGKAYINVSGVGLLATLPGAKLDIGGVERTPVTGDHRMLGFTEKPMPGMLTCEISLQAGAGLAALKNITDATVTFECDTGQGYSMRGAYVTKTLSLTAGDSGKVSLELAGEPAEEMGV
jgi:3-hydroxymyristoyl/3-hydroxydecanoyl-(acyl carrier protein) dehydratase